MLSLAEALAGGVMHEEKGVATGDDGERVIFGLSGSSISEPRFESDLVLAGWQFDAEDLDGFW